VPELTSWAYINSRLECARDYRGKEEGRQMIIYWEDIRWDVDDAGTSSATLADEEHNSLTLESCNGRITFRTDGSPSFDASTIHEIVALCAIMTKEGAGQHGGAHPGRIVATSSQSRAANSFVPEQRRALDQDADYIDPDATRLPHAELIEHLWPTGIRALATATS
jgi:hypothetical protein